MLALVWFFLRSFWPLGIVVFVANLILPSPQYSGPTEEAEAAVQSGDYGRAKRIYREAADADPLRLEFHRGYLRNHFRLPKYVSRGNSRDDETPRKRYEALAASYDPARADIGRYGIGLYQVEVGRYPQALEWYQRISNKDQPYIHNSIGFVLLRLDRDREAEAEFHREIAIEGNVSGACSNLARLYDLRGDYDSIRRLEENPTSEPYVASSLRRKLRFLGHDWGAYLTLVLTQRSFPPTGVAAAVVISAMWFLWLRRLDFYEPENVVHKLCVLIAAFLLTELLAPLAYDFYDFVLGFNLDGGPWVDLLFCIFGIGFIEETIKILPVLALVRFSGIVNESVDYVIYASVSALGFALAENIGYFGPSGLSDIGGRALSASVAHMALSSIAVSGYVLAKYAPEVGLGLAKASLSLRQSERTSQRRAPMPRRLLYGWTAAGFGAACLLHGIYDFFLVSDGFWGELAVLSFLIFLFKVRTFKRLIGNLLNHSEFYDPKAKRNVDVVKYLSNGVLIILGVQFVLVAWSFGPTLANYSLARTLLFSWLLIAFVLADLGAFQIRKGEWASWDD